MKVNFLILLSALTGYGVNASFGGSAEGVTYVDACVPRCTIADHRATVVAFVMALELGCKYARTTTGSLELIRTFRA
jgi:hypothetical protein